MGFGHVLVLLLATSVVAQQPVPTPIPGSRLIQTSRIEAPLEVRSATTDDEAILAGTSHIKQSFVAPHGILIDAFVTAYRHALFNGGWKLIDVPKVVVNMPPPEGDVDISAHYMTNGRNLYTRITRMADGSYEINVADVGDEDWAAMLAKDCRVRIPSIHFDLDRPTIREFDSEPTLFKLANVLKGKNAPAVEIQGHVDNIGEAGVAARQQLSEGRAKAVAAWLVAHGVRADKVTSKGYGKTRPIADNDTDLGRATNRRIEVSCVKKG